MIRDVDYTEFPDGPLVLYVIKKLGFSFSHPNFDDAFQSGMIEVLRCRGAWDPEKGTFATYAFKCIRGAVIDAYRNSPEKKAYDRWHRDRGVQVKESRAMIQNDFWSDPKGEISEIFFRESEAALEDRDRAIDAVRISRRVLRWLTKPERRVIREHFFQDRTFQEIADRMGVSRQRAHQYYQRGLDRIRARAEKAGLAA